MNRFLPRWMGPVASMLLLVACADSNSLVPGDDTDAGTGGTVGTGNGGIGGNATGGTGGVGGTVVMGGTGGTSVCNGALCDIFCEFGNKVDKNGCALCACNPPPTCGANACGPPPPGAVFYCPDGSIQREICAPAGKGGQCSWTREACPTACNHYLDLPTCEAQPRCQWLAPGCSGNTLPQAGCFERASVNCTESAVGCVNGKTCTKVTVDYCAGRPNVDCLTCASPTTVCL